MRRIVSACLLQTVRFDTYNDANPENDLQAYCSKLDRNRTKYVIEEKKVEADGTIIIKIKKQYNAYSTNGYID